MADNQSTFMRNEIKYMLDDGQYRAFREAIAPYTKADAYARYSICNLYFDTDQFALVRQSMEKPVYKEKLRLRSYGIPSAEDTVFLELKKKFKKEVFKRRVSMPLRELEAYLEQGVQPDVSAQVLREIEYFRQLYPVRPMVYIAYDRVALQGVEDETLRMTFDENLRYRRKDLHLQSGDYGEPMLAPTQHLCEIKVQGAMPLWLSRALDQLQIYPVSFSKVGYCYQHFILPQHLAKILPFRRKRAA